MSKLTNFHKDGTLRNKQHELFCQKYVAGYNITEAAKFAKFSPKTAYSSGQRVLKRVEVQKRVATLQKDLREATGVDAVKVVREFACLALADPGEAYNEDGNLLDIKAMPASLRRAISSIETVAEASGSGKNKTTEYVKKIRFWDKNKALENLGKHLGIYNEDNKQKVESLAAFLNGLD
jgi:phage terminase small subunit